MNQPEQAQPEKENLKGNTDTLQNCPCCGHALPLEYFDEESSPCCYMCGPSEASLKFKASSSQPEAGEEKGLQDEVRELRAWKESAMIIMKDIPAIGKALNVPLGESIHDKILYGIQRLKVLIDFSHSEAYENAVHHIPYAKSLKEFKSENNLL